MKDHACVFADGSIPPAQTQTGDEADIISFSSFQMFFLFFICCITCAAKHSPCSARSMGLGNKPAE